MNMLLVHQLAMIMLLWGFLPTALAQFHFFDNMFGQHQQQQQRPSASQWAAHFESVQCSNYLCPGTLDCVVNPSDCPCPAFEDIKCTIPDKSTKGAAAVVCVRGKDGCTQVENLLKFGKH